VSALVLDAAVFIAIDRNDRAMVAQLQLANKAGLSLRTTGVVVAEVWRDPGGRQANIARLLGAAEVVPVDQGLGRDGGVLMGRSGTRDPADATLVAAAREFDRILTGDPGDIRALVAASGKRIQVVAC